MEGDISSSEYIWYLNAKGAQQAARERAAQNWER